MQRTNLLNTFLVPFLVLFLFLFIQSCDYSASNEDTANTKSIEEPEFEVPASKLDLEKPLEISQKPSDIEICKKVDKSILQSNFSKARWGVIAISLNDGRVVCGRNAQKLFNPASIHKLLTSIVSLDKLGGNFRWKTSIYSTSAINGDTLEGDLILYGRGSPNFDDNKIQNLVQLLKTKGLRSIKGDIIGDESYFKGDNLGDGWSWNAAQWYYGAASSALSINQNKVTVTLQNGKPKSDSSFVELSGETKPIDDIEAIGVKRELGTNNIYVWGNGNNLNARIAINKPALLAAKILKESLEQNGISVDGNARSVDWKSTEKLVPKSAIEIASVESETIGEVIRKMNKDSVNLNAELILRTLGKNFGNEAPNVNPKMQKLRGDDSAGASVVKKWLHEKKISVNQTAIHDGSGLSRLNHISPETIGRALVFASQNKFSNTFKNSLPVAGQNGTLRGRLKNVSGKILGKTGSITYVNSLAGYARNSNETLAFVIIGNNIMNSKNSSTTVDKITTIFASN